MSRLVGTRNVLIGAGAYYLSLWISPWLSMAWISSVQGFTYSGLFATIVLLPIVGNLPTAFVAFLVGVATVLLAQDSRRLPWVAVPALFFSVDQFFSQEWATHSSWHDRAAHLLGIAFVGSACVAGGWVGGRYTSAESAA